MVVRPEDIASFVTFAEPESSTSDDFAELETLSLPLSEAEEEAAEAALPLLVTAAPALTWLRDYNARNQKHTKQACASCRQKKQ
eukprot:541650-Hanusia_phi.AAC.1